MERKPKLRNYISYGVGDFLGGGSLAVIGMFFLIYMSTVVGMNPFYAGLIYAIGRIWDGFSDPIMGFITDRTRSRFGRRRLFFLLAFFPVGLFFMLIWFPVNIESQLFLFLWYTFVFLGFNTTYTVLMVPYTALNAEISLDLKVRAVFSGFKQYSSGFSAAVCSISAPMILDHFSHDLQTGYMIMGIAYGLLFSLPWIAVFFGTWEVPRKLEEVQEQSFRDIIKNFYSVFKNRSFRTHLGMYIFGFAGMDMVMNLLLFFATYYMMMSYAIYTNMMIAFVIAQAISMPIYIKIGNVYGQGRAYLTGAVIWIIGLGIAATFTPESSLYYVYLGTAVIGSGMCGVTVMPWVILPNVTDVDEMITTHKRAGTYSGMMTLLRKIVSALTMLFVGAMLNLIGFDGALDVQGADTQTGLRYLFFIMPAIVVFIGLIFSLNFKINTHKHQLLMKEIQRLESGGSKEDVDEETCFVCEELSGIKYEDLYKPLLNSSEKDKKV